MLLLSIASPRTRSSRRKTWRIATKAASTASEIANTSARVRLRSLASGASARNDNFYCVQVIHGSKNNLTKQIEILLKII